MSLSPVPHPASRADASLRAGRPEDAHGCGVVCYEAFKTIADAHRFPPDFPSADAAIGLMTSLLSNPNVRATVAEVDGRVAGSNFLWKYGPVAGIGPITVDADLQDASLGRRLMENALAYACEARFPAVRLVQAAYHNRSLSLYTKLGFRVREPLATIQGEPPRISIPGHAVRPAADLDLQACARLCMRVHGHAREQELREAIRDGSATVVERDGRLCGYAAGIGFFGHAVAETNKDLEALIGAAQSISGPGLLLPARNTEVFTWCLEHGLRVVQPMTLMSIGLYNEPTGAFLPSILF